MKDLTLDSYVKSNGTTVNIDTQLTSLASRISALEKAGGQLYRITGEFVIQASTQLQIHFLVDFVTSVNTTVPLKVFDAWAASLPAVSDGDTGGDTRFVSVGAPGFRLNTRTDACEPVWVNRAGIYIAGGGTGAVRREISFSYFNQTTEAWTEDTSATIASGTASNESSTNNITGSSFQCVPL